MEAEPGKGGEISPRGGQAPGAHCTVTKTNSKEVDQEPFLLEPVIPS